MLASSMAPNLCRRPRRATGRRDRAANMVLSAVTAMMLATILHSPLAFSSTVTPSTYTEDKTTLLQPGDMTGVDDVDVSKVSSFLRGHEGFSLGQDDVSMGIEGEWTPAVDNEISFTLGVHHEGDGGKLRDGRDRCFTDEEGYRRCYPTAFFIGTSKCGKDASRFACQGYRVVVFSVGNLALYTA